jgi:hypothetical protein
MLHNRILSIGSLLLLFAMAHFSCKCPILLAPSIKASATKIYDSSQLTLFVPYIKNTRVYWSSPLATHEGETWHWDTVNPSLSGDYQVWYRYKNRQRCTSEKTTYSLLVQAYPSLPSPKLLQALSLISASDSLLLSVESIPNAEVYWQTPAGQVVGNPLIIAAASRRDSGEYVVRYHHKETPQTYSAPTSHKVHIYSRTITTTLNNKTYYVDFTFTKASGNIWLRANKTGNDLSQDILAARVETGKMTLDQAKASFCKHAGYIEKGKYLAGCLVTAGAAGCLLGAAEGTVLIPACVVILELSVPGIPACLEGVASDIADVLGLSNVFNAGTTGGAIANKEATDALTGLITMACSIPLNKTPKIDDNGKVTLVPNATPALGPTPPNSGKADTGVGHEGVANGNRGNGGGNTGGNTGGSAGGNSGGGGSAGGSKGPGNRGGSNGGGRIRIP